MYGANGPWAKDKTLPPCSFSFFFWQEEVQKEGQEGEEQKEEEKGPHNTKMVQTNWR